MTYPQLELEKATLYATLHTNKGDIKVALFEEEAPKTVANFVGLAKKGYYNDVTFHRVIHDFMIQGGDPTGTGMGGESIYGDDFEDEFTDTLFNIRGALSMANAGPNTNGSQFFIVTASNVPTRMLAQMQDMGFPEEIIEVYATDGGTPWLDQRHTVFGQVVEGMEVVEKIQKVKTGLHDKPKRSVIIRSISIEEA